MPTAIKKRRRLCLVDFLVLAPSLAKRSRHLQVYVLGKSGLSEAGENLSIVLVQLQEGGKFFCYSVRAIARLTAQWQAVVAGCLSGTCFVMPPQKPFYFPNVFYCVVVK